MPGLLYEATKSDPPCSEPVLVQDLGLDQKYAQLEGFGAKLGLPQLCLSSRARARAVSKPAEPPKGSSEATGVGARVLVLVEGDSGDRRYLCRYS